MPARARSQCYLCGGSDIRVEAERVRDNSALQVLKCCTCGLLFLSSFDHATDDFYSTAGMHGGVSNLEQWRRATAVDDDRRFEYLRPLISGKRVLDFGCGNGGFLLRARKVAGAVAGVDLEAAAEPRFRQLGIPFEQTLKNLTGTYDVITLFHVLEHLKDPRRVLDELAAFSAPGGQIVIEVPNADDALLRLYGSEAFKRFTYWSCHLYVFAWSTLRVLFHQVGVSVIYIKYIQRYSLSNHLHWLARGEPGGHEHWSFLDSQSLHREYEAQLASVGLTDTLIASIRFDKAQPGSTQEPMLNS